MNARDKEWLGKATSILSKQDKPFQQSPQCQSLIADGTVSDFGHLPSHFAEQVSKIVAEKGIPHFQAWQND
ncbi:family 20 glycosylhydrolase [Vibrio chagasii]|nr:family 20 glycosylhydrolase [Vibrio chagasii]